MIAMQYHYCAFYGVEDEFGLHLRLTTHDSVLMFFLTVVAADIDGLGLLRIVRRLQCDAMSYIVAFVRLCDTDGAAIGLASAVGGLQYQHVDGSVLAGATFSRVNSVSRDLLFISWAQTKSETAEFFQLLDGIPMSLSSDEHPPLMPRFSNGSPSVPSPMSPMIMKETS